jgi:hypothetical protein
MLERRADAGELAQAFTASQDLAERAGVYADAYVWRQVEALHEDFPKTKAYFGCETFDALAQAFVYAHPSRHPSLAKRGTGFAEFLRAHDARVANLAALEWARAEIFDAPASETVSLSVMQQPGVENARLQLIPALAVITLAHPAVALWRALDQESELPAAVAAAETIVIWRAADTVYHAAIDADEAAAIAAARAGQTVAEICACFAEHTDPAQRAGSVLARWFADGMVAALCDGPRH